MNTRSKKSSLSFAGNAAFNLLSIAGPLLFAFIATPLLVFGLGLENYGYYSLALAIIGFGFTTGIGRIPVKYIPEKRALGKSGELPLLLSATIVITLSVAAVQALLLAIASPFLVTRVLNVPGGDTAQLKSSIYLACLIGAALMISQVFQSAMHGIHMFRAFALITITASFAMNLGSVLIASSGFSYFDILIWNLLLTIIALIVFASFARSGLPEFRFTFVFDREVYGNVARFAASIFVYQSITSVFYLFERAYVLRNFGAEVLTYYTIPLMLGIYLHGLVLALSQVAIPKFNERIADIPALIQIYRSLTKVVLAVAVFIALLYYSVGGELLSLWLGPNFAVRSYKLLVIDGIAFCSIALLIPAWILSESSRKPGLNASSPLVTYLVGIAAIAVLGGMYGVEGVAGGRLLGSITAIPIIFVVEKLVFDKILWELWAGLLSRIVIAAALLIVFDHYVVGMLGTSWPSLVFGTIIFAAVFWGVLFASGYIKVAEVKSAFGRGMNQSQDSELKIAMP